MVNNINSLIIKYIYMFIIITLIIILIILIIIIICYNVLHNLCYFMRKRHVSFESRLFTATIEKCFYL